MGGMSNPVGRLRGQPRHANPDGHPGDTTMTTTRPLRFFWNGIKASDGKLQKCSYCDGPYIGHAPGTITVYAKDYRRFSPEVREAFTVENGTDTMTDYFENDRFRVQPSHYLYDAVRDAMKAGEAHRERQHAKRIERWKAKRAAA
jgi:hypothetical protein